MGTKVIEREVYQTGHQKFSAVVAGQGTLVLCLHGFPDNNQSFRYQIPALVDAGYRVVCPLLPGYEPSSQLASGHYDMETVADSLAALVCELQRTHGTEDPVHLIGHDWGAIAGYALCVRYPELIRSFVALTIPYNLTLGRVLSRAPIQFGYSWYIQFFQLRYLSDLALEAHDWTLVEKLIRLWSPRWVMPADHLRSIKQTLAQPGVKSAALAYYRGIFGVSRREQRARALLNSEIAVPTLQLWGKQDGCISSDLWSLTDPRTFTRGVEQCQLDAGHFLHQERPDEINSILLEWLQRQS